MRSNLNNKTDRRIRNIRLYFNILQHNHYYSYQSDTKVSIEIQFDTYNNRNKHFWQSFKFV